MKHTLFPALRPWSRGFLYFWLQAETPAWFYLAIGTTIGHHMHDISGVSSLKAAGEAPCHRLPSRCWVCTVNGPVVPTPDVLLTRQLRRQPRSQMARCATRPEISRTGASERLPLPCQRRLLVASMHDNHFRHIPYLDVDDPTLSGYCRA